MDVGRELFPLLSRPLKAVNSKSDRPIEALLAVGSVVAILALLLVLSGADVGDNDTSASAPSVAADTVIGNEG